MKLVLHVTRRCNLRCKYCYVPVEHDEGMTAETGRLCVDFAVREAETSFQLSFFGGEPLLAFPLVREVTEYAAEKAARAGLRAYFRLSTNAMLLCDEHLAFFRRYRFLLNVSLDGPEAVHDAMRVGPRDRGSHSTAEAQVRRALEQSRPSLWPRGARGREPGKKRSRACGEKTGG